MRMSIWPVWTCRVVAGRSEGRQFDLPTRKDMSVASQLGSCEHPRVSSKNACNRPTDTPLPR